LRNSIEKARGGDPVLFLVDEMLAGTNSRDRCIAAEWMLESLIAATPVTSRLQAPYPIFIQTQPH
jgi:hypothetical protein